MNKFLIKLDQITVLQAGLFTKPAAWGDVNYLKVSDYDEKGVLLHSVKPCLKLTDKLNKHLLLDGDVLFAAKGYKNFAFRFDPSLGPTIASSAFLVIRVQYSSRLAIFPDFIVWWLNHPQTLLQLKSRATGTALPSITKQTLQELLIPLPSREVQKSIIQIDALHKKAQTLTQRITDLKERQFQQSLLHFITDNQ